MRLNLRANRGLACARNASQKASDIEGRLRSRTERLFAGLREGRSGSFRSHVDGVGCAGARASQNRTGFVHQHAFRLCAAAIKSEDVAHRSEEHTSELQSRLHLVCRLLLEKKKH